MKRFTISFAWILLIGMSFTGHWPDTGMRVLATETEEHSKPFFEVWEENNVYGNLNVAMDGTVLLFSLQGDPHPDKRRGSKIYLKRSEDGGTSWSDHELIGKRIDLDWQALGIGPYDGKGWGRDEHHRHATLGTSVVDESTGEIMIFITALYPAPFMYKSRDHGKTWQLEKIEFKKDSNGFLPIPNAACDPAINLKHGPHRGRLLVPSRVMVNYDKRAESEGYTNAVYSDDHGKTWHSSEPFPLRGTGESGLVELNDGTIYLNSRTHTRKGNRWVAYSDDSGHSWRDLQQDDELFDGPPDMYGCKAALLKIDRDDRDILLFSSPTPSLPGRLNIRVWVSFDGGKSWPHSRLIRRGPGNYTWMTQGRKGTPSEGFIYLLSGKDWMARFNLAWLLKTDDADVVLGSRERYSFADSDVYHSSENAEAFQTDDPKLDRPQGYQLKNTDQPGQVVTHRLRLPSGKMKVSCHVPDGKLFVWMMDESNTRVRDSHAITGSYLHDHPIEWQDGPIDSWVGREVYLQFMLEGNAQVFEVRFDEIPEVSDDPAAIAATDNRFVLPPRNDYVMDQTPSFIKSTVNANTFEITKDRLEGISTGYQLVNDTTAGQLLSRKFSLPGDEMRISCDASSGSLTVSLLDADGNLVQTSHPISGGLKVRERVSWPEEFTLGPWIASPVSLRFDLQGGAKLYAVRFDDLFWD